MILNISSIEQMDQRYRTTMINSLAGFRQAVLVGTQSVEGVNNLAIFNSLIHLGANPALFGLVCRPNTVQRDTLQNIMETNVYTLNFIPSDLYKLAHQTSARYDSNVSEFEVTGLIPKFHAFCKAPLVEEAVVKIYMKLESLVPIAINNTELIIGSIQNIELKEGILGVDGYIDLASEKTLIAQGLDAYFEAKSVGRLPYAKPKQINIQ
jgi:flavin reductase (DIM6/NTAB) family NADH-FMN oxidoreductase RutF